MKKKSDNLEVNEKYKYFQHLLQFDHEIKLVKFINDSKCILELSNFNPDYLFV